MKKILFMISLLTILVSMSFATGGSEDKKSSEPIKIGVTGPFSGDLASYGIPTAEAVKIIAKKVNDAGGIDGRQIVVVEEDDMCDPNQSTTVASKLVAEKVVAVVGPICSGATQSAMPTYVSAEIPVISPSSTNPSLAENYDGFFRTIAADDIQGVRQAEFLAKDLGLKNIAVIHDQQDYGRGLAESAKENLEKLNANILLFEGVTVGAVDYSAIVSKIINSKAEAIVYGGYDADGSKLLIQLRAKGFKGAFIAGDGFKGAQFLKLAGESAEGAYASGPADYSTVPKYQEAMQEYEDMKGEVAGSFYAEGYAAMSILVETLKAGKLTGPDIKAYLQSGQVFDTSVGEITFDEIGNSASAKFDIYQVKNGKFEVVR